MFRSSCKSSSVRINGIRVVQLNGCVEEFDNPVSVSEVTAKLPKHFVCTHAQLLSTCSKPLMRPDTLLEPGQIYFLLPLSVFQSNDSPLDLAPVARKLSKIAKSCRSKAQPGYRSSSSGFNAASPVSRSPASSPSRVSNIHVRVEKENGSAEFILQKSSKSRSWKPILSTIRERSFNRRSESELQEKS